jgi:uncharacterized damage-inducible protein DinB
VSRSNRWGHRRKLDASRHRLRDHSRRYLDSLGDAELVTPRQMRVEGETWLCSPADMFVHVLLHERQHHEDVNTLLYHLGVEVPSVEYIDLVLGGDAAPTS